MESSQPKMEYRYLGNSGLRVSVFSYGNMTARDNPESYEFQKNAIKRLLELGVNFIDTAEVYEFGYAETSLGKVLKDLNVRRESVIISTKIYRIAPGVNDTFLSRKHIIEGCNGSLKRLQLDYVDILFCHRPDYETPLEETCRAMHHLIEAGKVFYWGTSEWPADRIAKAIEICDKLNLHKPIVEQSEYNMLIRDRFEKEYRRVFSESGYGSTIWSPLGGGVLAGKYNEGVKVDGRYKQMEGNQIYDFIWVKYMGPQRVEDTCARMRKLGEYAKELGYT